MVFSTQGQKVPEAADTNACLQGRFVELFPRTAWRTHFAEFVKDAGGWGFTPDYQLGFRMIEPRRQQPLEEVWKGELWQFKPEKKLLWRVDLPPDIENARLVIADFFTRDGQSFIVVSSGGTKGYILNRTNGAVVNKFSFGHIETDQEAKANKRKWLAGVDEGDPSLTFSSYALAAEPSRRLLAAGAFYGRRVRIISLDPPFRTTFEVYAGSNPWRPFGGTWLVRSVSFAGGKYLVVKYESLGGRLTSRALEPKEIYDIDTKQRVWSEDSLDVRSVCLSPDAKKLASVKRGVLEVRNFEPRSIK